MSLSMWLGIPGTISVFHWKIPLVFFSGVPAWRCAHNVRVQPWAPSWPQEKTSPFIFSGKGRKKPMERKKANNAALVYETAAPSQSLQVVWVELVLKISFRVLECITAGFCHSGGGGLAFFSAASLSNVWDGILESHLIHDPNVFWTDTHTLPTHIVSLFIPTWVETKHCCCLQDQIDWSASPFKQAWGNNLRFILKSGVSYEESHLTTPLQ